MTDNKQDKNAQNNIEKDVVVAETAEQNNTENNKLAFYKGQW